MVRTLQESIKHFPIWRFFSLKEEHRTDWINPVCVLILGLIGVFSIYSAQLYSGGSSWKMQAIWLILGIIVYCLTSMANYKLFLEYAHIIYAAVIIPLIPLAIQSVLVRLDTGMSIPLVETRNGSTRWIDFGKISIQPSETAKLGTLIMIAGILARSEISTVKESLKVLAKVGLSFLIPIILIFSQPDLGSSLVFPPIVFSLLYVSNLSRRFFVTTIALFLLGLTVILIDINRYEDYIVAKRTLASYPSVNQSGLDDNERNTLEANYLQAQNNLRAIGFEIVPNNGFAKIKEDNGYKAHSWLPLKDYQRDRIHAFIDPETADPSGGDKAYNINQSRIAVAGGGLTGKGFGEPTQATLGYLPASIAHNDFIFCVIAEESGFLGGLLVISLFFIMIANTVRIAGLSRDRFGMLLAVGVSVFFMVHIFINIGMTIGLMPITGLPLPFLSYGGSFVLSCCALQGLVQSVYRYRKDFT